LKIYRVIFFLNRPTPVGHPVEATSELKAVGHY